MLPNIDKLDNNNVSAEEKNKAETMDYEEVERMAQASPNVSPPRG